MKVYCDSSTTEACVVLGGTPFVQSYLGKVTVNVGEYQALLFALFLLCTPIGEELKEVEEILSDSQLIVNQVNGLWQCRNPNLLPFRDKAREWIGKRKVSLRWVPREENKAGIYLELWTKEYKRGRLN